MSAQMRIPTPSILLQILVCLAATWPETACSEEFVARAHEQGYSVSVGLVTLGHGGGDVWSRPDNRVEIRRRDRAVAVQVNALSDKINLMISQETEREELRAPLLEKRRLSEVRPGPKLTELEAARLAELEEKSPPETYEERRELRELADKRVNSELEPGPPLTPEETAELDRLDSDLEALRARISNERSARAALKATVVGYTQERSTRAKRVHFDWHHVLTVYLDDILLIKVVDVDTNEDDVYGEYAIQVTAETLRSEGNIELGPTIHGGVRELQLRFTAPEH